MIILKISSFFIQNIFTFKNIVLYLHCKIQTITPKYKNYGDYKERN